jgi:hypothetical protein
MKNLNKNREEEKIWKEIYICMLQAVKQLLASAFRLGFLILFDDR